MRHIIRGLSVEAREYLDRVRVAPGDPCPCCGTVLAETSKMIGQVVLGGQCIVLHRYVVSEPGYVAEEFYEGDLELLDVVEYYFGLQVLGGRSIRWRAID